MEKSEGIRGLWHLSLFYFVKELMKFTFWYVAIFADILTNSSDLEGFGIQIIRIRSNFVCIVYTY